MKSGMILCLGLLFVVLSPVSVAVEECGASSHEDQYVAVAGVVYVDDDPIPYVYVEANGIPGLQRGDDDNRHDHCWYANPDLQVF